MILLLVSLWLLSGFLSFVYWWTKEFDLRLTNIFPILFISVLGPICFIFGWAIMNPEIFDNVVLIKRRK